MWRQINVKNSSPSVYLLTMAVLPEKYKQKFDTPAVSATNPMWPQKAH